MTRWGGGLGLGLGLGDVVCMNMDGLLGLTAEHTNMVWMFSGSYSRGVKRLEKAAHVALLDIIVFMNIECWHRNVITAFNIDIYRHTHSFRRRGFCTPVRRAQPHAPFEVALYQLMYARGLARCGRQPASTSCATTPSRLTACRSASVVLQSHRILGLIHSTKLWPRPWKNKRVFPAPYEAFSKRLR